MTTTTHPSVPAIVCTPWCADGDGHPNDFCREDQTCWSPGDYLELELEPVRVEKYGRFPALLGVMLKRQTEAAPVVCYIHADLPQWNIDTCVSLTATEALQMAAALSSVAYVMQGGEGTEAG
jgi:hypothetical protein